jgi:hypothetical protein
LSKGPGIRGRGPLSGPATTDCQQGQRRDGWSATQPAAAPPPRRKAQAEKRIPQSERGSLVKRGGHRSPRRARGHQNVHRAKPVRMCYSSPRSDHRERSAGHGPEGAHGRRFFSNGEILFFWSQDFKICFKREKMIKIAPHNVYLECSGMFCMLTDGKHPISPIK